MAASSQGQMYVMRKIWLSPPSGKLQVITLNLQIQLVTPSPPPDNVSKQQSTCVSGLANSDKHY